VQVDTAGPRLLSAGSFATIMVVISQIIPKASRFACSFGESILQSGRELPIGALVKDFDIPIAPEVRLVVGTSQLRSHSIAILR